MKNKFKLMGIVLVIVTITFAACGKKSAKVADVASLSIELKDTQAALEAAKAGNASAEEIRELEKAVAVQKKAVEVTAQLNEKKVELEKAKSGNASKEEIAELEKAVAEIAEQQEAVQQEVVAVQQEVGETVQKERKRGQGSGKNRNEKADETPAPAQPVVATVTEITVSPAEQTLGKGDSQTFEANVAGTNNPDQTVTWKVAAKADGTGTVNADTKIDVKGLLTVAENENARNVYVIATSVVDNQKTAYAKITVQGQSGNRGGSGDGNRSGSSGSQGGRRQSGNTSAGAGETVEQTAATIDE